MIPKYFILARCSAVCLSIMGAPKWSGGVSFNINRLKGGWGGVGEEVFGEQTTADDSCNAAFQAERLLNREEEEKILKLIGDKFKSLVGTRWEPRRGASHTCTEVLAIFAG